NNDNNNNDNNNNNNNDNNLVVEDKVIGKVYFNKPIGWNNVYLYVTQNGHSLSGDWPGKGGYALDKNIYEFDIMESMKDVNNITLEFNNGKYYKLSSTFPGYNKLLNITLDAYGQHGSYEWIDYNSDSIIAGGPVNTGNVKNVIFMIGDGMGVNHIKAAEIYQGYDTIFSNFNNTYVSTYSSSDYITDSAASATALATGKKTINYYVGIDYYGNKIETLAEYAHKKGLKTGLVATQTINHATPAGFSAHNFNRSNYDEIAVDQVESGIDLMLGGGTNYFNNDYMINLMNENNYTYINNFNEIYNIDANTKVIGTFAPTSFHETSDNVPSLEEMTSVALNRLDSENGFFLMVEGSNIDTYSHNNRLENMLIEVIEFDKAVRVAKNFVDSHPDTLLIITADHETGRLNLNGANNRGNLLSNAQFTSSWGDSQSHTASFVKVFTYGKTAYGLTVPSLIDNTYIHNYVKQGLINQYGY
ncbi:MAG: alkaline phosphatase, partial [Bacilli bacterium]|nr:alkaline phosphatase [Bacilli bacterium]